MSHGCVLFTLRRLLPGIPKVEPMWARLLKVDCGLAAGAGKEQV
jgi:hypothetical protein